MSAADVVVTGLGATTPLGGDVRLTWAATLAGQSGVGVLRQEWARTLPVRIAAEVAVEPSEVLSRARLRRLDRSQAFALIASAEAVSDAGLVLGDIDRDRLAVSLGSGVGGLHSLLAQDDLLEKSGAKGVSIYMPSMGMGNGAAACVGVEYGARGGVHSVASACATGAEALSLGRDIIRAGRADVVIAGGTEAVIHALPMAGFAAMRAISLRNDEPTRASRPWDKGRDGFVLGEGAAVMVLERADHAAARGASIYARLAGSGVTSDGFDIVTPDPRCQGGIRAMTMAIRDAGISTRDVVHVNAHATATLVGDMAEARGIRTAVGDHAVVTATKSQSGHLLGAAGAFESILTVLAIRDGVVPQTLNLDDPEEDLGLDVPIIEPRRMTIGAALSNSFGFGGHNVALVFTRA